MLYNHAVFLTTEGHVELKGIADLWLKSSENGYYLLCIAADTEGTFTNLEFEDESVPGNMHLKIPHYYIRAIFFGESLKNIGFIQEDE